MTNLDIFPSGTDLRELNAVECITYVASKARMTSHERLYNPTSTPYDTREPLREKVERCIPSFEYVITLRLEQRFKVNNIPSTDKLDDTWCLIVVGTDILTESLLSVKFRADVG